MSIHMSIRLHAPNACMHVWKSKAPSEVVDDPQRLAERVDAGHDDVQPSLEWRDVLHCGAQVSTRRWNALWNVRRNVRWNAWWNVRWNAWRNVQWNVRWKARWNVRWNVRDRPLSGVMSCIAAHKCRVNSSLEPSESVPRTFDWIPCGMFG